MVDEELQRLGPAVDVGVDTGRVDAGTDDAVQVAAGRLDVVGGASRFNTELPGIQTPPPDRDVEPPQYRDFSTMTTFSPWCAAVIAAAIPAPPAPTTTTSNCSS